tara:strand:+ start:1865 stop:2476 length:612 start_codon:yes stop_codon:yes gene_type:complete
MNIDIKISKKPIPYKKAMFTLEKRVIDVKKGKKNELLWILEHPVIFTGGIRAKDDEILDKKIKIFKTNRGGKITLHNPGQKIVYFVINLNNRKRDIRKLISLVELSVLEFLKIYKIKGNVDRKNIGIWTKNKKISAIGIKIKKWIAYHGCSININNNLSLYKKILPCGLNNDKITSFKDLKIIKPKNIDKNLKLIFLKNLSKI